MQRGLRGVFDLVIQHFQSRKSVEDPFLQKVRIEENQIPLDVFALEERLDGVRQCTMEATEGRINNDETILDCRQKGFVEESFGREGVTVEHVVDQHLFGREERVETRIVIEKEGLQWRLMKGFEDRRTTDANDTVPRTGKDHVFEKVIDEGRREEELSVATAIFQWMEKRTARSTVLFTF